MRKPSSTSEEPARHWEAAYAGRGFDGVSWYQHVPRVSLELIAALGVPAGAAVIDVGGGASALVDHLVERDFVDVSVLDLSAAALAEARRRVGDTTDVSWLNEDLLLWRAERRFDVWHDRAVFHFLVATEERDAYLELLRSALRGDGCVVLATFAPDAPERCSGLPVARYTADELAGLLGPGFELVATRREVHTTPTGNTQPFTWVAGRIRPG